MEVQCRISAHEFKQENETRGPLSRPHPNDHDHDYRPSEPPSSWYEQDWLFVLAALDHYALEGDLIQGQERRAYQLLEAIRGVLFLQTSARLV